MPVHCAQGAQKAEQNQWNAMLEMCFHFVVALRLLLTAGPRSVATLSATCTFACDVLNGPRENPVVRVFDREVCFGPTLSGAATPAHCGRDTAGERRPPSFIVTWSLLLDLCSISHHAQVISGVSVVVVRAVTVWLILHGTFV